MSRPQREAERMTGVQASLFHEQEANFQSIKEHEFGLLMPDRFQHAKE